jgi:hypothetical protein
LEHGLFKRRLAGFSALLLILAQLMIVATPLLSGVGVVDAQGTQLPRVSIIKLWGITHTSYMAKFYGEDYVVVCTSHCDVSLDGRFISSRETVYVYKTLTGTLLGSLSGPGTWRVDSWEPFSATRVSGLSGFFSADSSRMIVNPRFHGGTMVAVNDTSTWTSIPIDWDFTDIIGTRFYATQLDYDGGTLAVGYIGVSWPATGWNDTSKLLVYKYDPGLGKYVKVYEYAGYGDYGRRLQMTLDGQVVLVGGIGYPYLDIHVWNGTSYSVTRYPIPDGNITALGISDPYNVGYVIIGTLNGWVIIGKYDRSTKEFTVIYQSKHAPDNSWFYNPFYDRWIPSVAEVFALCTHRDMSRAGRGVVYDVLTNKTVIIDFAGPGDRQWSAAAISPQANYVFLGVSLYIVVRRDVQFTVPRARLWGTLIKEMPYQPLNTSIIVEPPPGLDILFFSGRITVKRIYVEPVPVDLVTDPDILYGRLASMHTKYGIVQPAVYWTEPSEVLVEDIKLLTGTEISGYLASAGISDYLNYVAVLSRVRFSQPPYFTEGNAYYGAYMWIPLSQPLSLYSEMYMSLSTTIHSSLLFYDKDRRALGVFGSSLITGAGAGVSTFALSRVANTILASKSTASGAGAVAGLVTVSTAAKLSAMVGVLIVAWGGLDAALVKWGGFGEIDPQTFVIIAPVIVDKYGRYFTAVELYLPLEESVNLEKIYSIVKWTHPWAKDVGFRVTWLGSTWAEYKRILEGGFTPQVDLYSLVESTIASKYGLSMADLKLSGVFVSVATRLRAKVTFWEWAAGGVGVDSVTVIGASSIQIKGVLKAGTVTDPSVIASILGKVYVNDQPVELKPGRDGAYGEFSIQLGAGKLVIRFGKPVGYYGDVRLEVSSVVKSVFRDLDTYGYTTLIDYNWSGTLMTLSRIDLVDMPRPMLICERVFIYAYGNFTHNLTKYFNLTSVIDDPSSPTGKYYYYVTISTLIFDPADGGMLQPGKKYIINYYYATPPDASIVVYLNGTHVTSTLPHHATVVINNTAPPQNVTYNLTVTLKYYRGLTEVVASSWSATKTVEVGNYTVAYDVYSIAEDVYSAVELMRTLGVVVQLEIYARIVNATYNYFKVNDEYRLVYIPSPRLPQPLPPGNFTVTARVFEFRDNKWIPSPNALVEVYRGFDTTGEKVFSGLTNESGIVELVLESGTYTFRASKPGFIDYNVTLTVASSTLVNMYLAPVEKPPVVTPVPANVTVTFYVYNATSGSPVQGASITATYIEPANSTHYGSVFTATTDNDGKATLILPVGKYKVDVSATGYEEFTGYYIFDRDTVVNIPLVPVGVAPPAYYALIVQVFYADDKPYEGANVTITNGVSLSLKTDTYGTAVFALESNLEYNVTVSVYEPLHNRSYVESRRVLLVNDTRLVFTVPWNSTQPPEIINETPYYWLGVQVLWANGLPFQNADVRVYNYTTGDLIAQMSTNGAGIAWFLLPAFQVYLINVTAVNPYNVSLVFTDVYVVNLTENIILTVNLPWSPEQPEYAQAYRIIVYAYDSLTGLGVPDVVVIARRGDMMWSNKTNSTGYADLYAPFTGYYNITGVHPNYMVVWREIVIAENNTLVNLPLTPVVTNITPPINGTLPPVIINGTAHYWLTVQVLWSDGYPFHGAVVRVYNHTTGELIASGVTNGTGAVHFLIRANTTIKYTVNATNPLNTTQTYYTERVVNMTQHYWFVHVLPWTSQYFAPEVAVSHVELVIHRGQGYYYGNVSHLVLYRIWTNTPQNITVFIGLYNVTGNTPLLVNSKTVNLTLSVGLNTYFEWISVNASAGGVFAVLVNITRYANDTVLDNNYMWSNQVFLKPFTDFYVVVLWRPVQVKQRWTILPGDLIEIDIGVYIPINTTALPAVFEWFVMFNNLTSGAIELARGVSEEIRATESGMLWRNMTIAVPWTNRIYVNASVEHPWEDAGLNNYVEVLIRVDPDIELKLVEYTRIAREGEEIRFTVEIRSNVEREQGAIMWITVEDNTTNIILARRELTVEPYLRVVLTGRAPENPAMFWFIRKPSTTHMVGVKVTGFDLYTENNYAEAQVTVLSNQWVYATIGVALLVALIALINAVARAGRHVIEAIREQHAVFVKRKSFVHAK